MTRIAFINMCPSYRVGGNYTVDPVHLVAMDNICKKRHMSKIFSFGVPCSSASIKNIAEYDPDVLALSYIGHFKAIIEETHDLLKAFGQNKPKLIIGGTDINYYLDEYAQFSQYYPKDDNSKFDPFWIVKGQGENFMKIAASNNFNLNTTSSFKNIDHKLEIINGMPVISAMAAVPLSKQGFIRDKLINYEVHVKWSTGCWGDCPFCANEKIKIDYRSPKKALEELRHLNALGAHRFSIASPNFLTDHNKGSLLIRTIIKENSILSFTSRVDSLYSALIDHPKTWALFSKGPNMISLGVESFLPHRLMPDRIGKYRDIKKAAEQKVYLEHIFDFFKGSKTGITLFVIPYDHKMDLEELDQEYRMLDFYALKYFPNVHASLIGIGQVLHHVEGSAFSKTMKPEDFFNFKKDPRTLFMASLYNNKLKVVDKAFDHKIGIIEESYLSRSFVAYLLVCIDKMREVPVESFNIEPILNKGDDRIFTPFIEEFYRQLEPGLRDELRSFFDKEFYEYFPIVKLRKK